MTTLTCRYRISNYLVSIIFEFFSQGDPADYISTAGLEQVIHWYDESVIPKYVARPSTRLACDPR